MATSAPRGVGTLLCAAALVAAGPCPALAQTRHAEYDTGATTRFGAPEPVVSRDGYHYATVMTDGGRETLHKDGRQLGRDASGTFTTPSNYGGSPEFIADIADNGVLFHALRFIDPNGRAGRRLALDARPHGALYDDILKVRASPAGDNAAFVTRDGKSYSVSTLSGRSPATEIPPSILRVASAHLFYKLWWNARDWIYRDTAALAYPPYQHAVVHPVRPVVAGTLAGDGGVTLEVDGKKVGGPWVGAHPRYTEEGALVVLARTAPSVPQGSYDVVMVDGRAHPVAPFTPDIGFEATARPGDGTPFYVGEGGVIFEGGRPLAHLGKAVGGRNWAGFSPSGRRWAAVVIGPKRVQIAVDGVPDGEFAPTPLANSRIVFDSETELHYMGRSLGKIVLVCAALDGRDPRAGRCAREAAGKGYKPAASVTDTPGLMKGIEPSPQDNLRITPQ